MNTTMDVRHLLRLSGCVSEQTALEKQKERKKRCRKRKENSGSVYRRIIRRVPFILQLFFFPKTQMFFPLPRTNHGIVTPLSAGRRRKKPSYIHQCTQASEKVEKETTQLLWKVNSFINNTLKKHVHICISFLFFFLLLLLLLLFLTQTS